jgi:hypothetical protein
VAKNSKMVRVQLDGDPYASSLFCPYCGASILDPEAECNGECPHLIYSDIEGDPEEEGEQKFLPNDVCFVYFEEPPASRDHYFVFREAGRAEA